MDVIIDQGYLNTSLVTNVNVNQELMFLDTDRVDYL